MPDGNVTHAPGTTSSKYVEPWRAVRYSDVIIGAMASQITSLTIVYSTVYSGADQRKHQSSASLAFVRGIHRWPVNSPRKEPVTRKCFHLVTSSCIHSLTTINSCYFDSETACELQCLCQGSVSIYPIRYFIVNTVVSSFLCKHLRVLFK